MTNDVTEMTIKTVNTAFEILIRAHGLTHIKENIYEAPDGMKYHLSKFGLQPVDQYNLQLLIEKRDREIRMLKDYQAKKKKDMQLLKVDLEMKTQELSNSKSATLIENLRKKIDAKQEIIYKLKEKLLSR